MHISMDMTDIMPFLCTYIVHLQSYCTSPWPSRSCITHPLSWWPQLQLRSLLILYLLLFLPLPLHLLHQLQEVDGVLDKFLYYFRICFCHLFSVFVVHARTHTQINLSLSLPAIVLVTCVHMLTTLLIALGRLSAAILWSIQ